MLAFSWVLWSRLWRRGWLYGHLVGHTLWDVAVRDGTRPLALMLALQVLAWGTLLGLSTGPRTAVLIFGLPIPLWSAVFAAVGAASLVALGLGARRARLICTLATLLLWGLATAATAATNWVGTLIFYLPTYIGVFRVLWDLRLPPTGGPPHG